MHVTLDYARALDALARHGTLQAAARALGRSHSAVLHAVRSMEAQLGLELVDRAGQRLALTRAGHQVLALSRELLHAERRLLDGCEELKTGWEPALYVIFDGVVDREPLLRGVRELVREGAPTRIAVESAFLGGVEEAFVRNDADLMITIVPPSIAGLEIRMLPTVRARLVASRAHPLARLRRPLEAADLDAHVLLTVRGSDPRLELSTRALAPRATVALSDFEAKRHAILAGIGFGWLPDHLLDGPRGELRVLRFAGGSEHVFQPRLAAIRGRPLGRAANRIIAGLVGQA